MQQLRYADELRPVSEVPLGEAQVKPAELKMALQIVDQAVSEEFRPQVYEDDVRKRILTQIERKVEGQEIQAEPDEAPRAQVIDLMAALKASLGARAGERRPARRAPEEAPAARARAAGRGAGSARRSGGSRR
jgi:DNA end-binding protein Ku